jgi:hypothetical protein
MKIKFVAMKILKVKIIYEEGRKHNNESCIQKKREEKNWFCYNRKKMIRKNFNFFCCVDSLILNNRSRKDYM